MPALPAPEREHSASLHLPADVEALTAEEILALLFEQVPGRVALACSFQKEETVLLDIMFALEPKARVFAIDTHHLFPETYAYWRDVEKRYGTSIEVFAGPSPDDLAAVHGERLWEQKPDLYLAIAKVAPLVKALAGLDAWVTGIRRDQSPTRADAPKLGWDEQHELWKASPLADWTDERCWEYIRARELPYNALHDRGYDSIGDSHSTEPGAGRSGRWVGADKVECGIHTVPSADVASLVEEKP